jgi:hypothetical protein
MAEYDLGREDEPLLKSFRRVAKAYAESFKALKDQVAHLLGNRFNYESGIYREGLLRQFLRGLLPTAVSVDSGFIYGFEEVPTSAQLDILIWNSAAHSAVFKTSDFVVVAPESVVAVISVKSKLDPEDIRSGIKNLATVVPLDVEFRSKRRRKRDGEPVRPILKAVVAYELPKDRDNARRTIVSAINESLFADRKLARGLVKALRDLNPIDPDREHRHVVERMMPKLICAIDPPGDGFIMAYGPPDEEIRTYGPGLRRLPFVYPQGKKLTSSFEKLIYYVLSATYLTLETPELSTTSAWADINPRTGMRVGDVSEAEESLGESVLVLESLPSWALESEDGK